MIELAKTELNIAYDERIDRTVKEEYLDHWKSQTFSQLRGQIKNAVKNYNSKRSHDHLEKRNPAEFIRYWSTLK